MQAGESVLLSEIARVLEEPIAIKKTHGRLVRRLKQEGLGEHVQQKLLEEAAKRLPREPIFALDVGEITKPHAKKMQYLATVRDGSDGELKPGYWTMQVAMSRLDADGAVMLYHKLYSAEAPGFVSENDEMLTAVDAVVRQAGTVGIWTVDRSGDRDIILEGFLERGIEFVVRLVGDRHLRFAGRKRAALEIAQTTRCPYGETIVKHTDEGAKVYHVTFGYRPVRLPGRQQQLWLLVVRGFGVKPMMLLTNKPLRRKRKLLWSLLKTYLKRWSADELFRFIKQSYDLENVRVLGYRSLQNLIVLLTAACYFATRVLGAGAKLKVMLSVSLRAAKRIFSIPPFHAYAVADGLRTLFARHPGRIYPQQRAPDRQLRLFPT